MLLIVFLFLSLGLTTGLNIALDKNFANLRNEITSESASQVIYTLNGLNSSLPVIYLYLNSPGGDVMAGLEVINYIKSVQAQKRKVNCIAYNAMSMAFVIFQYCSETFILPSSTLMQHQMALSGIKGKLYDINSRLAYYNQVEQELNGYQAERLKMTSDEFRLKIQHDWWLYSGDIISQNGADKMVTMSCSFTNFEENVTISTFFGDVNIVYSACPLISQPLKISFSNLFPVDQRKDWMKSQLYSGGLVH